MGNPKHAKCILVILGCSKQYLTSILAVCSIYLLPGRFLDPNQHRLCAELSTKRRLPELEDALTEDNGRDPTSVLERFVSDDIDPGASTLAKVLDW